MNKQQVLEKIDNEITQKTQKHSIKKDKVAEILVDLAEKAFEETEDQSNPQIQRIFEFEGDDKVIGDGLHLIFPPETKIIGNKAFCDRTDIIAITVNEGLEKIFEEGFYNTKIKGTLIIPDGCKINAYAFASSALNQVVLPENPDGVSLGDSAFEDNKINTPLVIPEGYTVDNFAGFDEDTYESYPGADSIFRYNLIPSVSIPGTLTHIPGWIFEQNKINIPLILPEGVEEVGLGSFKDNEIPSVTFPSTCLKINAGAFINNLITEVTVQTGCDVDEEAFDEGVIINYEDLTP